jgi:hypothetical protein
MSRARRTVSVEALGYLVVIIAAAWLRFSSLGVHPLGDAESLAALSSAPGLSDFVPDSIVSYSPAYRALTRPAFALFGANEASARLVPAFAGLLLVLSPVLLRRQIGRGPALLAAAFFALSPTLWLASRTASGTMIGALSLLFALAILTSKQSDGGVNLEWAAASVGLGLVSGPAWLSGVASIVLGIVLFRLIRRRVGLPASLAKMPVERILRSVAIGGLVALGVATGLGFLPDGLRGFFDGLGTWAEGWFQTGRRFPGTYLLHLVAYEPLALVFGGLSLFATLRHRGRPQRWISAWALGALLLVPLHPATELANAVWFVLPLLLLASISAAGAIDRIAKTKPIWLTLGAGLGILALLSFSYLQFRSYVGNPDSLQSLFGVPTLLALGVMGLGLALIALLMLGFGWTPELAQQVAAFSGLIGLVGFTLSAGAQLNLGEPSGAEIAHAQVGTQGLTILRDSLTILSEAEFGRSEALPVQASDEPTPALAWTLRGYPRLRNLNPEGDPPVILVREDAPLPGEYLGQSLTVGEARAWSGWLPPDPLAWILARTGPTVQDRWVMLVRQDVAGVDQLTPAEDLPEEQ